MATGDEPPEGERQRGAVVSWLADRPVQQYVYAAAAVVLLVTGLFGGLAQAPPKPETPLTSGTSIEAAPFTIAISRASTTTDLGSVGKSTRGRFVSVIGTVRNGTDTTVGLDVLREAVTLHGLPDVFQSASSDTVGDSDSARPWGIYVVNDSTSLTSVGPGLTYEIVWIYEQKATAPPPATVSVEVNGHTLRANSVDQQVEWLDPTRVAGGDLPLKVVPPS